MKKSRKHSKPVAASVKVLERTSPFELTLPNLATITYDATALTLYVSLKKNIQVKLSKEISPNILVDYDDKGEVVGIEVIGDYGI